MRSYPYFIFDLFLLVAIVSLVLLSLAHCNSLSYALAFASLAVFGVIFIGNQEKAEVFDAAVRGIKGISSWESDFLSLGTLRFVYRGEKVRYSSLIRQRFNGGIPVDYSVCMENGNRVSFDIARKRGRLSVSGNRKFLTSVKKDVNAFNRKYKLRRMKNSKGLLKIDARMVFTTDSIKKDGVARFLKDYLEFGHSINKRLKARR
jgi:hypothetical protein